MSGYPSCPNLCSPFSRKASLSRYTELEPRPAVFLHFVFCRRDGQSTNRRAASTLKPRPRRQKGVGQNGLCELKAISNIPKDRRSAAFWRIFQWWWGNSDLSTPLRKKRSLFFRMQSFSIKGKTGSHNVSWIHLLKIFSWSCRDIVK